LQQSIELIHRYWDAVAGFAWTDIVKSNREVVSYVSKYVSKGGEVLPYLAKKIFTPNTLPRWWKESISEPVSGMDNQIPE
jgi:hypothetical protein